MSLFWAIILAIAGIALVAAMVAMALALGISALFVPLKFEKIPKQILAIPLLSLILFVVVVLDKNLSRIDGLILLIGYAAAVIYLIYLIRQAYQIKPGGEVAETLEKEKLPLGSATTGDAPLP
ncbi:MAG: hypothetical protein ACOCWA_10065 [Bacteroidota bacterium]